VLILTIACAVAGLCVGSFLNVVVYRVPRRLSVVRPASACPGCGTPIAGYDNLPVLSWLLLRGRCRSCDEPISLRYPLVESATAGLFALLAARFGAGWTLPAELVFAAGLLALALIDGEHFLLPRSVVYVSAALVAADLVAATIATRAWGRLLTALACGAGSFLAFFVVNFLRPAWLGFGDVRLSFLLGMALGWLNPWYLLIGFMAANLAGASVGIGLILAGKASMSSRLPYGVFLASGAIVAIFAGDAIITGYRHAVHGFH
jgi:leader peptidase (prepilin peptidase)/N-methyltransferase